MENERIEDEISRKLSELVVLLHHGKPDDRTSRDRMWAICVTEAQKLVALFEYYLRDGKN